MKRRERNDRNATGRPAGFLRGKRFAGDRPAGYGKPDISRAGLHFLIVTTILAISFLFYFNSLVIRLEDTTRAISDLYASFYASAASPGMENDLNLLFEEVLPRIDFPVILTDSHGIPFQWRNLAVPAAVTDTTAWLDGQAERLDRENPPTEMRLHPGDILIGTLHYGDSPATREIRWVPRLLILLAFLYLFSAFIAYRSHRAQSERSVWIGMARETAHQLGTPLTSLMAWTDLLTEKALAEEDFDLADTAAAIEVDIDRLSPVADRFEKIGVPPRLELQPLSPIIEGSVKYFERRLHAFGDGITMETDIRPGLPDIALNRVLLGWVLEIVLTNALDACSGVENGRIEIEAASDDQERNIVIGIRDNGRGMTRREIRVAFRPGYTTRRRGWGMGLAFARRIISDYHKGRIHFTDSIPDGGSMLEITLPIPPDAPASS